MTYPEAIQYLQSLTVFGMNPGLANMVKLASSAGNPQEKLRFVHVAGTNGKGSTCAMLESIYRAAGLRVGLFTSPHLVSFRERIQVNRELVGEDEVARFAGEFKGWMETGWLDSPAHPTFFEVVTAMALRYFAERACDLVIWETGLGGRLDATNIVTPLASVITNIGFDHQQWLGDTLAKIAFEKAGIFKPGVPVVTATDVPEALEVIQAAAAAMNAPITIVRSADIELGLARTLALPLLGEHQRLNAALAVATVLAIGGRIAVSDDQIRRGLEAVQWPGRLQRIETSSGRTILLDGAHNAAGAIALRNAMTTSFPSTRPTLVLGVLEDKDQSEICGTLASLAGRILLTPVNSTRTASPEKLRELCATASLNVELVTCSSLAQALEKAANDPLVLVTGSLYLVGEAMELLKVSTAESSNERGLNEWSQRK